MNISGQLVYDNTLNILIISNTAAHTLKQYMSHYLEQSIHKRTLSLLMSMQII